MDLWLVAIGEYLFTFNARDIVQYPLVVFRVIAVHKNFFPWIIYCLEVLGAWAFKKVRIQISNIMIYISYRAIYKQLKRSAWSERSLLVAESIVIVPKARKDRLKDHSEGSIYY